MSTQDTRYLETTTPGLFRDTSTGAVINRNALELKQYTLEQSRILQQQEINKKVAELSSAVSDIKEMLSILMRKHHGN